MAHHISTTPAMKYSWPFIMMLFIILIKLSSNQFLYLLSLQHGWVLLCLLQCWQGLNQSRAAVTIKTTPLHSRAQSIPGCFPAWGINRALIRNCRVTMIYSACIKLLEWNEIQPKIGFLSPVGQHRDPAVLPVLVGLGGQWDTAWSHHPCLLHEMLKKRREALSEDSS